MRVAILGGSFNPPHVGHAMVLSWLHWTRQVDEAWLLPTYSHAFGKDLLPFDDRVRLCEAAAAHVGGNTRVCTIERDLPSPSYTVDTLRALDVRHPEHRFQLVIGADILPETPRWKDWETIASNYRPIVVGRGGYPELEGVPTFPVISSTVIRERLAAGLPIDLLVPAKVLTLLTT